MLSSKASNLEVAMASLQRWVFASFRMMLCLGVLFAPTYSLAWIGELTPEQAQYLDELKRRHARDEGTCATDRDCPMGEVCQRPDTNSRWACSSPGRGRVGVARAKPRTSPVVAPAPTVGPSEGRSVARGEVPAPSQSRVMSEKAARDLWNLEVWRYQQGRR